MTPLELRRLIRRANPGGDCYEAAARYILDHRDQDHLILVHAEIVGQGPIEGVLHGHAWVEDGLTVIDQSGGRDLRIPKIVYESLARLRRPDSDPPWTPNWHRYTAEEAIIKLLKHKHYGPWDLRTTGGL